jgi:competence protein ComEA
VNSLPKAPARFLLCSAALAALTACVTLPRHATAPASEPPPRASKDTARVNLNHATRAELEQLPGVGPGLAERIVAHRERHGPFRRAEHLLAVRGFGERRFRELRHLVTVE